MNFECTICHNKEYQEQIACYDFIVTKEKFNIVSCKKCGLWQTFPYPPPDKISKYYESKEYISHSDKKETFFDKLYHLVRKYTIIQKLNLIKKYVPQGTILDYGCGTGYFLEICKKNNFETFGVEINEIARQKAINKNLFVKKSMDEYLHENKKFDIITLWHVLEHLYEPDHILKKIYSSLKENAILILALPNRKSYDALFYKEYWAGYDLPRHLFHFTKKDVLNLTKTQFKCRSILPMYFDSFYVSILSEKYKNKKYAFAKGLYRGMLSNLKAIKNQEYSSLIYVLQKN